MTTILITYNLKKHYVAHIYEHFLVNELLAEKNNLQSATIGSGFIKISIKESIKREALCKILNLYRLKESYYNFLQKEVQKEILDNAKNKSAYECFHLNAQTIDELKKKVADGVSQKDFEKFARRILENNITALKQGGLYQLTAEEKINNHCAPITKPIKTDNNTAEITYQLNTENIIGGLIFTHIFNHAKQLKYYIWLACPQKLFITFRLKNIGEIPLLEKKLNKLIIPVSELNYKTKGNPETEKFIQKYEWNSYFSPQEINRELEQCNGKYKLKIAKKRINLVKLF